MVTKDTVATFRYDLWIFLFFQIYIKSLKVFGHAECVLGWISWHHWGEILFTFSQCQWVSSLLHNGCRVSLPAAGGHGFDHPSPCHGLRLTEEPSRPVLVWTVTLSASGLQFRRIQLKCDGTRWRTGGEVKGKLANAVGSQSLSHYLGTCCIQH